MSYQKRSMSKNFQPMPWEALEPAIEEAKGVLRRLVDVIDPEDCLIAFSGGKDSIVAAHLAKSVGINKAHCDYSFCFADDVIEYRDIANKMQLRCEFTHTMTLEWLKANPDVVFGPLSALARYYAVRQQKAVADRCKRDDLKAAVYGRRNEENSIKSSLYQVASGLWQCCPIKNWTKDEVWSYILHQELPWPSIYNHPIGWANGPVSWPEVSRDLMATFGLNHLELIHDYDPRVLEQHRDWVGEINEFLSRR